MLLHCPSLHQRPHAFALGKAFAQAFVGHSAGRGKGEIVLFQAMQRSLKAIASPPDIVVEEYHGPNHQVTFKGSGRYSRASARCELSDLLVIVYDRQTKDARLTYIQAKSERTVTANAHGIAGWSLAANLEQWHLLAKRPKINGVGSFRPPADLLSVAPLSSIGSFAFFLHGTSGVDIYYAAASALSMPFPYSQKNGKLRAVADACVCGAAPECRSVYGNAEFGAFLFGLMIGSPILSAGKPTTQTVCIWLAAQLRGLAAEAAGTDLRGDLANELADLLGPDRAPPAQMPNVGATVLLLFGVGPGDRRRD